MVPPCWFSPLQITFARFGLYGVVALCIFLAGRTGCLAIPPILAGMAGYAWPPP
jgi:hypothetical protein